MRLYIGIVTTILAVAGSAQLVVLTEERPHSENQVAIDPGLTSTSMSAGNVILSDVVGIQKPISIFASFTRDVDAVAKRLDNESTNTTLLAPVNSAISSLPRKPWEDPQDYARLGTEAYNGNDGSERAQKNLDRFVEAHVIPVSPWLEGKKIKTLAGEELWWESRDEKMLVMPGSIEVEKVAKRVGNGEVWIIEKVINYS